MTASSGNSDGKVRVAYFDDQLLFREALASVLEESGSIAVIHSSGHRGQDIRTLLDAPVSAMLVCLDGQTNDPMTTVREARHVVPELPLCALVAVDRLDRAREALQRVQRCGQHRRNPEHADRGAGELGPRTGICRPDPWRALACQECHQKHRDGENGSRRSGLASNAGGAKKN